MCVLAVALLVMLSETSSLTSSLQGLLLATSEKARGRIRGSAIRKEAPEPSANCPASSSPFRVGSPPGLEPLRISCSSSAGSVPVLAALGSPTQSAACLSCPERSS